MLTIEKGWVYKIMESLGAARLNAKLVHPVADAALRAIRVRTDKREIASFMAGSLVIDHVEQRIYMRSDGEAERQRVVWSLLSNYLRVPNILRLTENESFETVCKRLEELGIEVGDGGEKVYALADLPRAFFDLKEVEAAMEGVIVLLAEIHKRSSDASDGDNEEIPNVEL